MTLHVFRSPGSRSQTGKAECGAVQIDAEPDRYEAALRLAGVQGSAEAVSAIQRLRRLDQPLATSRLRAELLECRCWLSVFHDYLDGAGGVGVELCLRARPSECSWLSIINTALLEVAGCGLALARARVVRCSVGKPGARKANLRRCAFRA